jgi:predicted polyphosphate/ATP-dependent NAD kinase
LVVNPIAGMGGRVALKGTDGPDALREARARGAEPVAPERARRALARLDKDTRVLAAPGVMGGDLAAGAGLALEITAPLLGSATGPLDTRNAVAEMCERGVELLLFAGGDGTARDIHDAIGGELPVVGIPTGVKMHSGVFAATPDAAGSAAAAYLRGATSLHDAEIADVDEDAARLDRVATRLYGSARVPSQPALMLAAKAPSFVADAALDAVCAGMDLRGLVLLGPGTTTAKIAPGTLLGVDAFRDGELIAADLDESGILALLEHEDARLILGVVGGQGSLLGRGNQQLSARVLRRIGREAITVVAAADKLAALQPPILRVDTGDDALDAELSGYIRVHTAPGRTIVMKVSA